LNFDDKHLDTEVHFPFEAFQYLELKEGLNYKVTNLLDETEKYPLLTLSSKQAFITYMAPWKGQILKLELA